MKKFILCIAAIAMAAAGAQAFDIKDALKKAGSDSGKSSGLETLAGAVGGLLSSDKIDVGDIVGDWKYSAPAVTFKSDNLLKKAGGAAVAKTITDKLAPIYKTAGFNNMTLTVSDDNTFVMKVRGISLKGEITTDIPEGSSANFMFNFKVAGKISLGKMETYVVKNALGGSISVMFDISKLVTLLEKVSSVANVKTIKSAVSLLKNYDGLCAGFELKK